MCGIFGIFGHPEAAQLTYLGLHALQHRGQESAGIASSDGTRLYTSRHMGLVADVFTQRDLERLKGAAAIGHVRYSTAGETRIQEAQPLAVECRHGSVAVAHNGNLVNAEELRRELEESGSIFQSSADTEVIVHLMARNPDPDPARRLVDALDRVKGAYSLLVLTPRALLAVRDPRGIRPLVLGRLRGGYVVASESTAFRLLDASPLREVQPGELLVVDKDGLRSSFPFGRRERRFCVFESVYFARPDAVFGDESVYASRVRMGRRLAEEHPVDADVVVGVPDSGMPAAIGYSRQSGIPLELGLIRSHYVGRTFIQPGQAVRHFGVRLKLSAVEQVLAGKRVVVVDDSIVRGTTCRKIVKIIRAAGAKEVHFRVSSPPTKYPCYYGIDTPDRGELIAASHTVEEIAAFLDCDSLGYLSLEGLRWAVGDAEGEAHCDACFTGEYPIAGAVNNKRRQLRLVGL